MSDCANCGDPNGLPIAIMHNGMESAAGHLCLECLDEALVVAEARQQAFEWLLESGIGREEATRLMTAQLEQPGLVN